MLDFSVAKSAEISVPVDTVYNTVLDLKSWPKWSPWLICEPEAEVTYAEDGKSYSWAGEVVGAGSLTIVSEEPGETIGCKLEFLKPWKSEADVRFEFEDDGENGTRVTWAMESGLPFFMFFMKNMMISMIGKDYERGLAMLKDYLENGHVPSTLEFGTAQVSEMKIFGLQTSCSIDEIGSSMEKDMAKLCEILSHASFKPDQPPLSIYHSWTSPKGECCYTVGVPAPDGAELPEGLVEVMIPDTHAFTVKHTGPYRYLSNAWSAGFSHQKAKQFIRRKKVPPFEIYDNDPNEVEENELVTTLYFPMK